MRGLALGVLLALAAPAGAAPRPVVEVHYVMGTYLALTAWGPAARSAARDCFQLARRLEGVFSRFDAESELERLHARAGIPQRVSADFAALLARAERLADATGGAFAVTAGGITALWRAATPPGAGELVAARALVGPARARLDGRTLRLAPGARLDFDGIAKGYAVDRCVARLRAAGVRRALVSFGQSSLYALGAPRGRPRWRLDVRGPDGRVAGVLRLRDRAVSVSATRHGGRAHIVDPQSGRLVGGDAVALVVTRSATDAEAYSKALLVWGAAGVPRVEGLGAAAVRLDRAGAHPGARAARRGVFAAAEGVSG